MPFLFDIPQPTDQLSISQGNILNNFNILGAIAGNSSASSASINTTSGFNWINLAQQGTNPPPGSGFPAGNVGLYAGLNATTAKYELYINKTNQATVTQIPATASTLSITSAPATGTAGWSYLPSGLMIQWGYGGINDNQNPVAVNFPRAFPTLGIFVTASATQSNVNLVPPIIYTGVGGSTTQTQFFIGAKNGASGNSSGYSFFAIGY